MDKLSLTAMDFAFSNGAALAGIATVQTLAGGPPSADITYVLPEAKSAVIFAVPLDQNLIPPYLSKKDRLSHERDNIRANSVCSGIALDLTRYLEQKGFPSVPVASNNVYRPETPKGLVDMRPDVSHRYVAVAAGIGHFGLSGNVVTRGYGAAVILGSMVTTAELEPTGPLPPEDNYCDGCRLCQASCASGMMDPEELTRIELGAQEHSYARRRNYLRCELVCGGFTGLHPSGKWSTWSPGRFPIPEDDHEFREVMIRAVKANAKWPDMAGGFHHVLMRKKLYFTCGNCQLLCHPDKEERKRRHRLLTEGGVVVQNPDGALEAVSAEAAKTRLASMSPEQRVLYEDIS